MRRIAIALLAMTGVVAVSVPAQASNSYYNRNTQSCGTNNSYNGSGNSAYWWCD